MQKIVFWRDKSPDISPNQPTTHYIQMVHSEMRYAIVSDIHANLQAWAAVMGDMASLEIDHVICVGDIVGYGPDPSLVTKAVRLPEKARPDGAGFLVVHAEIVKPMDFGYILDEESAKANFAACEDRIIFIGHSHRAGYFVEDTSGNVSVCDPADFRIDPQNRYIINPGSVGDPRSEDIIASYAIYDDATQDLQFRRCEFDIEAYRAKIDSTELVSRPYFINYLDSIAAHGNPIKFITPEVESGTTTAQINLSAPTVQIKEKQKLNPFTKIGIGVLLLALVAGIWFFTRTTPSSATDDTSEKVAAAEEKQQTPEPEAVEVEAPAKAIPEQVETPPEDPTETAVANAKRETPEEAEDLPKATTPEKTEKPKVSSEFPVTARYVRISLPRMGILCLAEVEVISDGKNIASQGTATQSSTIGKNGTADKAIDLDRAGEYKLRHISHTKKMAGNWWMLDLGQEYPIDRLLIFNRNEKGKADYKKRIWSLLDGFTLELLDENKNPVLVRKKNPAKTVRIPIK